MIDAKGPDGRPGLHRHPLALGPRLRQVPVGRVQGAPGRAPPRWSGMCGFSPGADRPGPRGAGARLGGRHRGKPPVTWNTFGEYLDHLRGARHVGQRRAVRGPRRAAPGHGRAGENRPATADEQKDMERLLAEALDAGAFGYSTGPRLRAERLRLTEELIALARSMAEPRRALLLPRARRGGHARAGRRGSHQDRRARAACRVQIAHVKASGRENWGKMDRVAAHDRRRARPRRGRDRRRLSLPGGQHQDGQPPARRGCTTAASRSSSSASPIPRRGERAIARLPGGRRALAHRLGRAWAGTRS